MKPGSKIEDAASGISAIVVRAGEDAAVSIEPSAGSEAALGKRYQCATCSSEVLVTHEGDGSLICHGAVMQAAQPRLLPSAD